MGRAAGPSARASRAQSSALREFTTTRAPSSTNARAMPSPIPLVEPVMMAVFPREPGRHSALDALEELEQRAVEARGLLDEEGVRAGQDAQRARPGSARPASREKAGGVRMSSLPTSTWVGALMRLISLIRVPFHAMSPSPWRASPSGRVGCG